MDIPFVLMVDYTLVAPHLHSIIHQNDTITYFLSTEIANKTLWFVIKIERKSI